MNPYLSPDIYLLALNLYAATDEFCGCKSCDRAYKRTALNFAQCERVADLIISQKDLGLMVMSLTAAMRACVLTEVATFAALKNIGFVPCLNAEEARLLMRYVRLVGVSETEARHIAAMEQGATRAARGGVIIVTCDAGAIYGSLLKRGHPPRREDFSAHNALLRRLAPAPAVGHHPDPTSPTVRA